MSDMENSTMLGSFADPETLVGQFGVTEGMKTADFGSGSGHLGIAVAKRVGKDGIVYAYDIMESALEAIRGRASALGLANIDARRANLEVAGSTGLPDGSVDLVWMALILFQSQKKADIVREARRILKPGARMIIIDWIKGGGGLGPPDELRTDEETMKGLIVAEGDRKSVVEGKSVELGGGRIIK